MKQTLPLLRVAAICVAVVAVSAGYVAAVSAIIPHSGLQVGVGWSEPEFNSTWAVASSPGVSGYLIRSNGSMTVGASGSIQPGGIVSAQNMELPALDVKDYPFLTVTVRSDSVYLAVRVMVWPTSTSPHPVIVSTFNDQSWHTLYVNLSWLLGLTGSVRLYLLELGWVVVQQLVGPNPEVQYEDLALVSLRG